jgi:hypothetical protein
VQVANTKPLEHLFRRESHSLNDTRPLQLPSTLACERTWGVVSGSANWNGKHFRSSRDRTTLTQSSLLYDDFFTLIVSLFESHVSQPAKAKRLSSALLRVLPSEPCKLSGDPALNNNEVNLFAMGPSRIEPERAAPLPSHHDPFSASSPVALFSHNALLLSALLVSVLGSVGPPSQLGKVGQKLAQLTELPKCDAHAQGIIIRAAVPVARRFQKLEMKVANEEVRRKSTKMDNRRLFSVLFCFVLFIIACCLYQHPISSATELRTI